MAHSTYSDAQSGWFRRFDQRFLTPLRVASRDALQKLRAKLRSLRRRRDSYTAPQPNFNRRDTPSRRVPRREGTFYSPHCEHAGSSRPHIPQDRPSALAGANPPSLYMTNSPMIGMPVPSIITTAPSDSSDEMSPILRRRWDFLDYPPLMSSSSAPAPAPARSSSSDSISSEVMPRWSSLDNITDWTHTPTSCIVSWQGYPRRLELCMPPPESSEPGTPSSESPSSIVTASPSSGTRQQFSLRLRRLPSLESSFGPPFSINQFRSDWLNISHLYGSANSSTPVLSDPLFSIPEDRPIDLSVAIDSPVRAVPNRSSMTSSSGSYRPSVIYRASGPGQSRVRRVFSWDWGVFLDANSVPGLPFLLTAGQTAQHGRAQQLGGTHGGVG